jgi:hypothetical protein
VFLEIPQAGLSGIDTLEDEEIDMFFLLDQLLFFGKCWRDILEVRCEEVLFKVVSMKKRDISIVPQELELG